MLRTKKLADAFVSIDAGKEYDGKPFYWTTFYYYKGLMIDTGCPHTAEEAANSIEEMKLSVKAILLTHYHEDHAGGACVFKERFKVNVYAPEKSLETLANPAEIPAYRQTVWGQPKPVIANPLKAKMKFGTITVNTVETPGHSSDHVSFLIDEIMFMGDLVANLRPVIIMKDEDYIDLIDSLKTIADLDFKNAYGGHGVWDKEDIRMALNNLLELKKEIDMLHGKGFMSEQIVEKLFSNVPEKVLLMEEMSDHEWSRLNLVESLLGMRHKPSRAVK